MIQRLVLALSLLLLPVAGLAQPMNELGVFLSTSQFDDSELRDAAETFEVSFEEDMGYGVLFNRFWTRSFSTELAYQRLGADLSVSFRDIVEDAGTLDLDILSATGQFHFARGGFLSPYIGGGAAYISGEAGSIDRDEIEDTDLENELDFLVNAGLQLRVGQTMSVYVDGKYVMYEARGEGDADDESIEINPLILSAGFRWRF